MKVVDLCINARSGKNARPVSGDVTFDDGARYGWSQYDEATRFHGHRRMSHGGLEQFSFQSSLRATALKRALDGSDPGAVVEDYGTRYLRNIEDPRAEQAAAPATRGEDDDSPGP